MAMRCCWISHARARLEVVEGLQPLPDSVLRRRYVGTGGGHAAELLEHSLTLALRAPARVLPGTDPRQEARKLLVRQLQDVLRLNQHVAIEHALDFSWRDGRIARSRRAARGHPATLSRQRWRRREQDSNDGRKHAVHLEHPAHLVHPVNHRHAPDAASASWRSRCNSMPLLVGEGEHDAVDCSLGRYETRFRRRLPVHPRAEVGEQRQGRILVECRHGVGAQQLGRRFRRRIGRCPAPELAAAKARPRAPLPRRPRPRRQIATTRATGNLAAQRGALRQPPVRTRSDR